MTVDLHQKSNNENQLLFSSNLFEKIKYYTTMQEALENMLQETALIQIKIVKNCKKQYEYKFQHLKLQEAIKPTRSSRKRHTTISC